MVLIQEQVQHQKFGTGVITEQIPTLVAVQFTEPYGNKKFSYPSAFESFLTLSNPALREGMDGELRQIREQREAKRRLQEAEAEKIKEAERLAAAELKRATTKKRASAKKAPAKAISPLVD